LDWERLEEVHTRRIEREDRQREALAERTQLDEEWQATDSGLHWAELLTIQHTTDTHNNRKNLSNISRFDFSHMSSVSAWS